MRKAIIFSILALILGIIASAIGWMGFGGYICGIPAIILGILAFKGKTVAKVIGVLALILGVIGAIETTTMYGVITGLKKAVETPTPEKVGEIASPSEEKGEQPIAEEKKVEGVKIYKIGDKLKIGDVIFTVHSFEQYIPTGEFAFVPEGEKLMAVAASFRNVSDKELEISSLPIYDFYLRYQTEYGYKDAEFSLLERKKPELPHSGTLAPGKTIRGFETYSAPKDASGFQLVYRPLWGEVKAKIDLGK